MAAVAAVAILAAVALSACGSAGSGSGPSGAPASGPTVTAPPSPQALAAVTQAVARTLALTSSVDLSFSRPSSNVPSTTPKGASGTVDFRSPAGAIRIDLPGRYGGIEKMVFLPGTVFIEPPPSNLPLQAGKPWIFANFADIAKYKVNFPPYIVQTESINPAFTLSELAWGAAAAAPVGQSTFRGQQAAEYSVTVEVNRALSHATGPAGAVFAHALSSEISASDGGGSSAPVTLAAEVWVDGSGRLVGARVTPPGAGVGTLTLALGPFGVSVHTDVPPRAKVVDIAAMIPGGEQEALNGGDTDGA
ncbi:MAG TPA: hypothetical protein VIC86_05560 [Acidimicrobiales bacterium]